jgi:prepilin-type N-terminal cleavage/methylation domain-containing protein
MIAALRRGRSSARRCKPLRGGRLRRPGFSLVEILVAVLIIALVAAVVIPTIYGRLTAARADAIVGEMQSLQNGIMLFYRDVGRYPRRLDYLNALPTPATNVLDACGTQISTQNQAKYRGPYINREIVMLNPGAGITKYLLATGDSVESLLTRTSIATPTGGTQQVLQILVYGPDLSIAQTIDRNVDGTGDTSPASDGIIEYTPLTAPEYLVEWTIPIKLNAC